MSTSPTVPPPHVILEDINFQIEKGETVVLFGPTGAGKSSILRLLFGLDRADAGQIVVLGRNVLKLNESTLPYLRRNIGFVFQDFRLFQRRTVYENISLAMKIAGASSPEIHRRTQEVLQEVGLVQKRGMFPSMLSAGEQQRICMARAIVNKPPILLADEPTGNLDEEQAFEIFTLMKEINLMGTTIVLATHDKAMIRHLRPRVIFIKKGKIEKDGVWS